MCLATKKGITKDMWTDQTIAFTGMIKRGKVMSLFTKLFVSFLFSVLFSSAFADQVFYCVDSRAVALTRTEYGRRENGRFTISFSDDWSVAKVYDLDLSCRRPFEVTREHFFVCHGASATLLIDRMSKKYTFSMADPWSHVYDDPDRVGGGSTVSDGVCENF
jgi:hypothetical protein